MPVGAAQTNATRVLSGAALTIEAASSPSVMWSATRTSGESCLIASSTARSDSTVSSSKRATIAPTFEPPLVERMAVGDNDPTTVMGRAMWRVGRRQRAVGLRLGANHRDACAVLYYHPIHSIR